MAARRSGVRGVTLIELMFTLTLLCILVGLGVGMITGQINYYKSCGAAEQALWDLRRVATIAQARGRGGHPTGIMFYQGQVQPGGGGTVTTGWSYLVYGQPADVFAYGMDGSPVPPAQIAALTARQLGDLVNLPLTLSVVQDASIAPGVQPVSVTAGTRFQFDDHGRLDGTSPASGFVDFYDPSSGYFRLTVWNKTYAALSITPY